MGWHFGDQLGKRVLSLAIPILDGHDLRVWKSLAARGSELLIFVELVIGWNLDLATKDAPVSKSIFMESGLGLLPTKTILRGRGVDFWINYLWCGLEEKITRHMLLMYPIAMQIW